MSPARSVLFNRTNVIALMILVLSSAWLAWWFYDRSRFLYVTDARIASRMINVSSRIPGWVVDFPVREGEHVRRGDTLVRIDARDAGLKLAEVSASLTTQKAQVERARSVLELTRKQVESGIATAQSRIDAARSALQESRVETRQLQRDSERADSLLAGKMISEGEWEARRARYDVALQTLKRREAEVNAAIAELAQAEARQAQLSVDQRDLEIIEDRGKELEIQRERLLNTFNDHTITSPVNGVIDETFINPGEYVYPGQRLLMLHDPENIWIKANIKETSIRYLAEGTPVRFTVDAYPGQDFTGSIRNVGNSATSQFALLPSPNPSGNFTKITQRLEVQLEIDPHDRVLKPGMMVELKIPMIRE